MKCARIQELILSDYSDGQLDEGNRRLVGEHIAKCDTCKVFAREVRSKVIEPLRRVQPVEPPVYLWEGVRRRIASQEREGVLIRVAEGLRTGLETILRIPKPAIAFAAVAALIIAIVIARPQIEKGTVNEYLSDQVDFLAELDGDSTNGYSFLDTNISTGVDGLL